MDAAHSAAFGRHTVAAMAIILLKTCTCLISLSVALAISGLLRVLLEVGAAGNGNALCRSAEAVLGGGCPSWQLSHSHSSLQPSTTVLTLSLSLSIGSLCIIY